MKSYKLASQYFIYAYLIATIVGFISFHISIIFMWIVLFTLMPLVFGYVFYLYLKKTGCKITEITKETNSLIILWIIVSFFMDGIAYIFIIPIIFGYKSNWTFFIDQTPWIWLNYLTLVLIGYTSRYFFIKNTTKKYINKGLH